MSQPPLATVIGLGEVLWDCFGSTRRPGGAPANVAFHATQLGLRGVVCSRVGTDSSGDELVEYLAKQKLDTQFIQRDAIHPTGTVTVDASNPKDPRYVIHEDVAWDYLEFNGATERLASEAAAICFGTLAQRSETSQSAIHRCLAAANPACLLVYDVNLRQTWYDKSQLRDSLKQATIVKLNDEEVEVIAGLFDIPAEDHRTFAKSLLRQFELSLVCITRAERGCLLVGRDKVVDVPGRKVKVADTVGAGDAFTATLIAARLRHCPLEVMATFANEVGALVAMRAGGMPKLGKDLEQLKLKYFGSD